MEYGSGKVPTAARVVASANGLVAASVPPGNAARVHDQHVRAMGKAEAHGT